MDRTCIIMCDGEEDSLFDLLLLVQRWHWNIIESSYMTRNCGMSQFATTAEISGRPEALDGVSKTTQVPMKERASNEV
jgi:hypothetical protein